STRSASRWSTSCATPRGGRCRCVSGGRCWGCSERHERPTGSGSAFFFIPGLGATMPKKIVRAALAAAFLPLFLALPGCKGEAVSFNNKLAGTNKRLEEAGRKFGQTLAPQGQGRPVNAAEVRGAYEQLVQVLNEVKAETKDMQIPSSASAKRLYDTHQKFLQGQEAGVKQFGEIVRMVETKALGPGGMIQFQQTMQQLAAREQQDLNELRAAQQAFAAEHGVRIK